MSAMVEIEVVNSWMPTIGTGSWSPEFGQKAMTSVSRQQASDIRDYLTNSEEPCFWHVEDDSSDLYEQEIDFEKFSQILEDTGLSDYLTPYPEPWIYEHSVTFTIVD